MNTSQNNEQTSDTATISDIDQCALNTAVNLREFRREMEDCFAEYLTRYGLSRSQFLVLNELDDSDGRALTPAELAHRTMLAPACMSACLDELTDLHFVERTLAKESRIREWVQLTNSGKAYIEQQLPAHYRMFTGIFRALTPAEQNTLLALHGKLAASARELLKHISQGPVPSLGDRGRSTEK